MSKKKILIQLDSDSHSSVFDAVVAVDAGVDHLLQYASVEPLDVRDLVHGAIFTRGPADLKSTAIFVGGSDVSSGEALANEVQEAFFGPMRVSMLVDSNGANSTSAAAVLYADKSCKLEGKRTLVLAGTGPVGQRVALLAAKLGSTCIVHSRSAERASLCCQTLGQKVPDGLFHPVSREDSRSFLNELQQADAVIACGAAGVELLSAEEVRQMHQARVMIDLNAVPPSGIPGIDCMDKAVTRDGRISYGAIGVGGLKMKIHKAALAAIFERNDLVLGCEDLFEIGKGLIT